MARAIPVAILRGTPGIIPGMEAGTRQPLEARPEVITGKSRSAEVSPETTGDPGPCPLSTGGLMMIIGDMEIDTRGDMTEIGAQSPGQRDTEAEAPCQGILHLTPGENIV